MQLRPPDGFVLEHDPDPGTEDASSITGLAPGTLRRFRYQGTAPGTLARRYRGRVVFREDELRAWVEAQASPWEESRPGQADSGHRFGRAQGAEG